MAPSKVLRDWFGTFWRILIAPVPRTFLEEAEKAENKFPSAIGWAVFIALYSYFLNLLAGSALNPVILVAALLILPLVVALVPSATHFMLQRVFHQKQSLYDKVLYIYTAILVLFQLIINLTFFIPGGIRAALDYFLLAYQFVLLVMAIKTIAEIKYWQAVIIILVSVSAGVLVLICALPVITSLLGSVARNR